MSEPLTNHREIRDWVEARNGKPSRVKGTDGLLRIDFPGYSGVDSLEEISWEEFFQIFEDSKLALLTQDHKKSGEPSTFNKFVSRR